MPYSEGIPTLEVRYSGRLMRLRYAFKSLYKEDSMENPSFLPPCLYGRKALSGKY